MRPAAFWIRQRVGAGKLQGWAALHLHVLACCCCASTVGGGGAKPALASQGWERKGGGKGALLSLIAHTTYSCTHNLAGCRCCQMYDYPGGSGPGVWTVAVPSSVLCTWLACWTDVCGARWSPPAGMCVWHGMCVYIRCTYVAVLPSVRYQSGAAMCWQPWQPVQCQEHGRGPQLTQQSCTVTPEWWQRPVRLS